MRAEPIASWEELVPVGQTQERSLSGHRRTWIAVTRLPAKRVETAIPQQVKCVVHPRALEPFVAAGSRGFDELEKRGEQAES